MENPFPATANDRFVLATTVYGEARGEAQTGQIAVAWVVRNRAQCVLDQGIPKMFGDGTLGGAAQYPWQFSCWNPNSPEAATMAALTPDSTDPVFLACLAVADMVIDGAVDDPTQGSLYYYDDSIDFPAAWGPEVPPTCVIGRLSFFNKLGA